MDFEEMYRIASIVLFRLEKKRPILNNTMMKFHEFILRRKASYTNQCANKLTEIYLLYVEYIFVARNIQW